MNEALSNKVTITLGEKERTMRAKFSTMEAIETALGKQWSELGAMVTQGNYGLKDLATIIHQGLLGNGDTRSSYEQVGDMVLEAGMNAVLVPVIKFISIGFSGTKQVPEGPKAEAAVETAA